MSNYPKVSNILNALQDPHCLKVTCGEAHNKAKNYF
jgi:hypothetical protein